MTCTPDESEQTDSDARFAGAMKLVVLPFMSKVAPWHGQRKPEPVYETVQHACVHDVESATYLPADWQMTMIWLFPQFGSE